MNRTESSSPLAPRWELPVSGLLLCAGLALAQWRPLGDPDLFWHLKTGRMMAEGGVFFRENYFSWVEPHQPWVNFQWLAQYALWGVWRLGEVWGVYALRAALLFGGWLLAYKTALRGGARPALAVLVLLTGLVFEKWRFHDRPELFSQALVFAWFWLLPRTRPGEWRCWLPLLALQALWANLHGLFFLGPGLAAWWIIRRWLQEPESRAFFKRDLAVLAGLILVCCLNPQGLALLTFPLALRESRVVATIPEYLPFFQVVQPGPEMVVFWALCLLALWLALLQGPRMLLLDGAMVLFFVLLGMAQVRVAFTGGWIFLGMAMLGLGKLPPLPKGFVPLVGVLGLGTFFYLSPPDRRLGLFPDNFPDKALSFAARQGMSPRLIHDMHDGGFILWKYFPRFRTFVDPRYAFSEKLYGDYNTLLNQPWRLGSVARRHGARTIVRQRNLGRTEFYASYPAGGDFTLREFNDLHYVLARRGDAPVAAPFRWLCPCEPGQWLANLAQGPHRTGVENEIRRLEQAASADAGYLKGALAAAWRRYSDHPNSCAAVFKKPWGPERLTPGMKPAHQAFLREFALCRSLLGAGGELAASFPLWSQTPLTPGDLKAIPRPLRRSGPFQAMLANHPASWLLAQTPSQKKAGASQKRRMLKLLKDVFREADRPGREKVLLNLADYMNTWMPDEPLARRVLSAARRRTGLAYPENP